MKKFQLFAIGFILCIVTLVPYWQVLHHPFIEFDDPMYVTENPHVMAGLTKSGVDWAFTTGHAFNWHPLTWLSHMLDVQLFGMNAGLHHLTSLFLHILNTLLLFIVFRSMTGAVWRSAFVAALFGLHPMHVESVAWIAERKDVLCAFFWLLAMWCYLGYVRHRSAGRYVLVAVVFSLGLMAKPMIITLPAVLMLLDYWPLGRLAGVRGPDGLMNRALEKTPLFLLSAASCVITYLAQHHGGSVVSLGVFPLSLRITNALVSYAVYLVKVAVPFHLAVLYPQSGVIDWTKTIASVFFLVAITAAVLKTVRKTPFFLTGWLWYLITLLPVIGLIQVGSQAYADRYTYIPFIGIFIIACFGAPQLLAKLPFGKEALSTGGAIIVLAMMAGTWKQAGYWKDSGTLFRHTLAVTGDNCIAQCNLANVLCEQGKMDEAIGFYREALRIFPDYWEAKNNLGSVFLKKGRIKEALALFSEADSLHHGNADINNNLGSALEKAGRLEESVAHFREVLKINPDLSNANINLASTFANSGMNDSAKAHYREALRINPNNDVAHSNLGLLLLREHRTDEAFGHVLEALRLNPLNGDAHNNLGIAYAQQGRMDEAIVHFSEALRLRSENVQARINLGNAYTYQGKLDQACDQYRKVLELQPENVNAHNDLGTALEKLGRTDEAIIQFNEVLRLSPENEFARKNIIVAREKKSGGKR